MRFTGERVIPHRYELRPMLQEHLIRYTFAASHVQGANVIDLGCGCGYGAHALATGGAHSVTGVDISEDAISYARHHYTAPNLSFEKMDVSELTFPNHSFTAAVCLEVFEHVRDYEGLLREAVRVLAPGGTLVLSTPNIEVWSPNRTEPINPWHVKEFDRQEIASLLGAHLSEVKFWTQTTNVPGIIPFILMNLRVQRYYVRNNTIAARLLEWLHVGMMKVVMLPSRLVPGASSANPNIIVPEVEVPNGRRHYFVAVGRKGLTAA